jgi:hypothetical protein
MQPMKEESVEIPEIVIHQSKKVTFEDEKKCTPAADVLGTGSRIRDGPEIRTGTEMFGKDYNRQIQDKQKSLHIIRVVSCLLSCIVLFMVYYFVNLELYRQYRDCRDNLTNDEIIATVVSETEGYIMYSFNNVKCSLPNRGQVSEIGKKYTIYKSNNNKCSFDEQKDECDSNLFIFNLFFTMFGGACIVLFLSFGFFALLFRVLFGVNV